MNPVRMLLALLIQFLLVAQEGPVSFDVDSMGYSLTLESGLAMLANSYLAGLPWGLLRCWLRQGQEWTGSGLTGLGLLP